MKQLIRLSLVAALALGGVAAGEPPEKIKVLIVDGQNNHDWAETTKATKATLLASGRFTVDVSTTPEKKAAKEEWAKWRPAFSKYPVVLSNYNGQPWPEEVRKSFEAYIRGGAWEGGGRTSGPASRSTTPTESRSGKGRERAGSPGTDGSTPTSSRSAGRIIPS